MGRSFGYAKGIADRGQDAGWVLQDFIVPEPQDPPASREQDRVAPVMIAGRRMLTAINLDDQSAFDASEVDDEGRYRKLPTEAGSKLIAPQLVPQRLLGAGGMTP